MSRRINVAAVQMDISPAPTDERLACAGKLASQAAQEGAQLVVLPELFNTGYGYSLENHDRVEPLSGPTVTWMKETAVRLDVHLAGALMLVDGKDIYNALLLFAPDGRMWRYDKSYPWAIERGFFRGRKGTTVAQTDLGAFGMLICWDVGHLNLWKEYAGKVDMILISSCPANVGNPTFHFPNGDELTFDDMGSFLAQSKEEGMKNPLFGTMINQQTAWMGVPAVNTVTCGKMRTKVANGRSFWAGCLPSAPSLVKYLPQANHMEISTDVLQGSKVVDATGSVLAELKQEEGEGFAIAEVTLPDKRPVPAKPQPPSPLPRSAYLYSDVLWPLTSIPVYRKGVRRLSQGI